MINEEWTLSDKLTLNAICLNVLSIITSKTEHWRQLKRSFITKLRLKLKELINIIKIV